MSEGGWPSAWLPGLVLPRLPETPRLEVARA